MPCVDEKKNKYTVYLCLDDNKEIIVQYAYCQCPIGLSQSCSHIGGVLFSLNGKTRLKCPSTDEDDSCTSQLCQWIVPRNINHSPKPVHALSFKSSKPQMEPDFTCTRATSSIQFDPRHPEDRSFDLQHTLNELKELKKVFPNTGLAHDDVPEAAEEVTICQEVDPRKKEMEKLVFGHGNVPPLTIDKDMVQFIELATRGQSLCPVWHDLHRGRITSSLFGQVFKAGRNPNSLVKHIIEGSGLNKYSSLPPAVKWGQEHETCKTRLSCNKICLWRCKGGGHWSDFVLLSLFSRSIKCWANS